MDTLIGVLQSRLYDVLLEASKIEKAILVLKGEPEPITFKVDLSWKQKVIQLMGDGKLRTAKEIAREIGYGKETSFQAAMYPLGIRDVLEVVTKGFKGSPAIYRLKK